MINDKFEKTLDFIDLDPKFLISILKKYIIHITAFVSIITLLVLFFTGIGFCMVFTHPPKKATAQNKLINLYILFLLLVR